MKFLADENFDNSIVRGLMRRQPDIDIIRVQDVGLSGEDDPIVLEWAEIHARFTVALHSVLKRKKQRVHPTRAIASDRSCVSLVVHHTSFDRLVA